MTDQDFERKEKARLDAMFDAQFADEPTSDVEYDNEPQVNGWPLYSGLPQPERQQRTYTLRKWVGLTDDEIGDIIEASQITLKNYCSEDKQTEYARAIEAKLKEKNT